MAGADSHGARAEPHWASDTARQCIERLHLAAESRLDYSFPVPSARLVPALDEFEKQHSSPYSWFRVSMLNACREQNDCASSLSSNEGSSMESAAGSSDWSFSMIKWCRADKASQGSGVEGQAVSKGVQICWRDTGSMLGGCLCRMIVDNGQVNSEAGLQTSCSNSANDRIHEEGHVKSLEQFLSDRHMHVFCIREGDEVFEAESAHENSLDCPIEPHNQLLHALAGDISDNYEACKIPFKNNTDEESLGLNVLAPVRMQGGITQDLIVAIVRAQSGECRTQNSNCDKRSSYLMIFCIGRFETSHAGVLLPLPVAALSLPCQNSDSVALRKLMCSQFLSPAKGLKEISDGCHIKVCPDPFQMTCVYSGTSQILHPPSLISFKLPAFAAKASNDGLKYRSNDCSEEDIQHNQKTSCDQNGNIHLHSPAVLPFSGGVFIGVYRQWSSGEISNLDYICFLNFLTYRQFGDSNRHPLMPWVLDFSSSVTNGSEFSSKFSVCFRDLCRSKYRLLHGDDMLTHGYGATGHHVPELLSSHTFATYFARILPKQFLLKFNRREWRPEEYPSSIERIFKSTPDEAVPEFFMESEDVFTSCHADMCDLGVPEWFPASLQSFLSFHRLILESPVVSAKLHSWINITFGHCLSGSIAADKLNVPLRRFTGDSLVQLFSTSHPKRSALVSSQWNDLWQQTASSLGLDTMHDIVQYAFPFADASESALSAKQSRQQMEQQQKLINNALSCFLGHQHHPSDVSFQDDRSVAEGDDPSDLFDDSPSRLNGVVEDSVSRKLEDKQSTGAFPPSLGLTEDMSDSQDWLLMGKRRSIAIPSSGLLALSHCTDSGSDVGNRGALLNIHAGQLQELARDVDCCSESGAFELSHGGPVIPSAPLSGHAVFCMQQAVYLCCLLMRKEDIGAAELGASLGHFFENCLNPMYEEEILITKVKGCCHPSAAGFLKSMLQMHIAMARTSMNANCLSDYDFLFPPPVRYASSVYRKLLSVSIDKSDRGDQSVPRLTLFSPISIIVLSIHRILPIPAASKLLLLRTVGLQTLCKPDVSDQDAVLILENIGSIQKCFGPHIGNVVFLQILRSAITSRLRRSFRQGEGADSNSLLLKAVSSKFVESLVGKNSYREHGLAFLMTTIVPMAIELLQQSNTSSQAIEGSGPSTTLSSHALKFLGVLLPQYLPPSILVSHLVDDLSRALASTKHSSSGAKTAAALTTVCLSLGETAIQFFVLPKLLRSLHYLQGDLMLQQTAGTDQEMHAANILAVINGILSCCSSGTVLNAVVYDSNNAIMSVLPCLAGNLEDSTSKLLCSTIIRLCEALGPNLVERHLLDALSAALDMIADTLRAGSANLQGEPHRKQVTEDGHPAGVETLYHLYAPLCSSNIIPVHTLRRAVQHSDVIEQLLGAKYDWSPPISSASSSEDASSNAYIQSSTSLQSQPGTAFVSILSDNSERTSGTEEHLPPGNTFGHGPEIQNEGVHSLANVTETVLDLSSVSGRDWRADLRACRLYKGHMASVKSVQKLPLEAGFVSGSKDGVIKGWHWGSSQPQISLSCSKDSLHCLKITPDGSVLASSDGRLQVWDLHSSSSGAKSFASFALSSQGILAAGDGTPSSVMGTGQGSTAWDICTYSSDCSFWHHGISPAHCVWACTDAFAHLIDLRVPSGQAIQYCTVPICCNSSGNSAVAAGSTSSLLNSKSRCIAASVGAMFVGYANGSVCSMDVRSGIITNHWQPHAAGVARILATSQRKVFSCCSDRTACISSPPATTLSRSGESVIDATSAAHLDFSTPSVGEILGGASNCTPLDDQLGALLWIRNSNNATSCLGIHNTFTNDVHWSSFSDPKIHPTDACLAKYSKLVAVGCDDGVVRLMQTLLD